MTNSKERSSTEQDLTAKSRGKEIAKEDLETEKTTNGETIKELSLQDETSKELARYQDVLRDHEETSTRNGADPYDPAVAELRMAPLVWWNVKEHIEPEQKVQRGYAVLGHAPGDDNIPNDPSMPEQTIRTPVLLNTDTPWSAFLCGSQGSGKSHTLSCMLENCLLDKKDLLSRIGINPNPLAGLVFHYDRCQGSGVCEAAYLCTDIPTTVLVSPSYYLPLKNAYEAMAQEQNATITVEPLYMLPKYLDTERMKALMAVGKDDDMPLYMQTILKILREMALEKQGAGDFDYPDFKSRLAATKFAPGQSGPMDQRIALLESLMERKNDNLKYKLTNDGSPEHESDPLTCKPGTLTIIDLTDPVIDADSACVLFNICLSVFMQQTSSCGKIVALDEAHNYMTEGSNSAKEFTEKLLRTVREQRHNATRVVVATQEPGIREQLLDLCSLIMVHRCTSPAWFAVLKKHVGALYLGAVGGDTEGEEKEGAGAKSDRALFQEIVRLRLGESLLFCPTAAVTVTGGVVGKMHEGYVKFKTRQRVTADGGKSRLAGGT